eukprot:1797297-Rhodomonas_salina.3
MGLHRCEVLTQTLARAGRRLHDLDVGPRTAGHHAGRGGEVQACDPVVQHHRSIATGPDPPLLRQDLLCDPGAALRERAERRRGNEHGDTGQGRVGACVGDLGRPRRARVQAVDHDELPDQERAPRPVSLDC